MTRLIAFEWYRGKVDELVYQNHLALIRFLPQRQVFAARVISVLPGTEPKEDGPRQYADSERQFDRIEYAVAFFWCERVILERCLFNATSQLRDVLTEAEINAKDRAKLEKLLRIMGAPAGEWLALEI